MQAHPPVIYKAIYPLREGLEPIPAKGDRVKPTVTVISWELYTKTKLLQRSECLGNKKMQIRMQVKSTENQKMSLGRPVQGNCHIGCNTGSTGSDSGSTAATAERTGRKTSTEIRACSIFI